MTCVKMTNIHNKTIIWQPVKEANVLLARKAMIYATISEKRKSQILQDNGGDDFLKNHHRKNFKKKTTKR